MISFRQMLGMFVLGMLMTLVAVPALAHGGAQNPVSSPVNVHEPVDSNIN